jgi:excisionase family DNA binding protein
MSTEQNGGSIPKAAVTVNEFCKSVGIGRSTFYEEVQKGNIAVKKLGNRTLIKISEITRFLDGLGNGD